MITRKFYWSCFPQNENMNILVASSFWIYFHICSSKKKWNIYWSKQSFTGLGTEDQYSSWGLILGRRTGAHHDCPRQRSSDMLVSTINSYMCKGSVSNTVPLWNLTHGGRPSAPCRHHWDPEKLRNQTLWK